MVGIFGSLFGAPGSTAREQAYGEAYREAYEEMKCWVNSNTTAPKQWTNMNLTAAASHTWNTQGVVYTSTQTGVRDLRWDLAEYGPTPHPAFHEEVVGILLGMADSPDAAVRLAAVRNTLMPLSRIIMMQSDSSEEVRRAAALRMAWEEAKDAE